MKLTRRRILARLLGALALCVFLYVMSFGPATLWVISAVSGRKPAQLNPATYDFRLSTFKAFYSPLLQFRLWFLWCVSEWPEEILSRYDTLFERPTTLSDAREVFTILGPGPRVGESTTSFLRRLLGPDTNPRLGTEVYDLPKSHRVLVILAPDEDASTRILLEAGCGISATGYADLRIP